MRGVGFRGPRNPRARGGLYGIGYRQGCFRAAGDRSYGLRHHDPKRRCNKYDGSFSLQVVPGSVLKVSFVGYAEQSAKVVAGKTTYDFVLESDALEIEELVVVGYGTQKKASLTGAISAINNEEIITTKNENVQNMLTGKVAGLRVRQNSSEPGQFNTSMDIRGFGRSAYRDRRCAARQHGAARSRRYRAGFGAEGCVGSHLRREGR